MHALCDKLCFDMMRHGIHIQKYFGVYLKGLFAAVFFVIILQPLLQLALVVDATVFVEHESLRSARSSTPPGVCVPARVGISSHSA